MQSSHLQDLEILELFDEVMNNVNFLKYFIYHVQEMADFIVSLANRLKSMRVNIDRKMSFYQKISNCVLHVNKNNLQTNDLKSVFVKSLIETFSVMSIEARNSPSVESDEMPFENVFYQVGSHTAVFLVV